MKNTRNKSLTTIALCFLISVSLAAVTGYQGYAIFRTGAAGNGHAGMMIEPYSTATEPVAHIRGANYFVEKDPWSEFIVSESFNAVSEPKSGITSSGRSLVTATAIELTTENISYTLFSQLIHVSNAGTKVEPNEVTDMRCDGVVESVC